MSPQGKENTVIIGLDGLSGDTLLYLEDRT
jgi:hypothetical protein